MPFGPRRHPGRRPSVDRPSAPKKVAARARLSLLLGLLCPGSRPDSSRPDSYTRKGRFGRHGLLIPPLPASDDADGPRDAAAARRAMPPNPVRHRGGVESGRRSGTGGGTRRLRRARRAPPHFLVCDAAAWGAHPFTRAIDETKRNPPSARAIRCSLRRTESAHSTIAAAAHTYIAHALRGYRIARRASLATKPASTARPPAGPDER